MAEAARESLTFGLTLNIIVKPTRRTPVVGLVVKSFAPRACAGIFPGSSHTSDLKIGTPLKEPGVIGSVLGLVGPVSVYGDKVRWNVGSATSVSVCQNVKLSEQIRP